jgi:LmbE family N-acetylglucosaminyl deacetylase
VTNLTWLAGAAITALLCAPLLYVAVVAGRKRLFAYRYDVRQDADYDFARARPTRIHARIKGGRLEVPARLASQNTVLLALRIDSTILGHWFEPRVDIESQAGRFRQAFERGGSGLRYVNLSPLDLRSQNSLHLHGRFVRIRDQDVTLYYLPGDRDIDQQRILVISPHPDDAEIAAYGLYEGRDAYVVTVTGGDAGDPGIFSMFAGKEAFLEKGRVRTWNSMVVPMLGGIGPDRIANLGYFDSTLTAMKTAPAQPAHGGQSGVASLDANRFAHATSLLPRREDVRATWVHLVQDFEHLIKHIEPDIIVTPHPQLDEHADHQCTTVALIEAIRNIEWRRGALFLYTSHSPASARYPYGDAGDLVSLPPASGVLFDGIWSQTLSTKQQARKYLALDAMVDIRPNLRPASLRSVAALFKQTLTSSITDSGDSYYRRAVRANELFFVLNVPSLYEPGIMDDRRQDRQVRES